MATEQMGPLSQMVTGMGLKSGNPYAIAGGIGLSLLQHRLNRGERRRQQRLQQEMARWSPYTNDTTGLKAALQPRKTLAGEAFSGALLGQKEWSDHMDRSQNPVVDQAARSVAAGGAGNAQAAAYPMTGTQDLGPLQGAVADYARGRAPASPYAGTGEVPSGAGWGY